MLQLIKEPDVDIVWQPVPGKNGFPSSQALALDSRADHTLYHGTRGPGKTITQLMRFRRRVGMGYGEYWRGVIFDREFKNLSDLVAQSKRFFNKFDDGAKWLSSASDYKWVWPTGEELLFRHIKRLSDYDAFHGHEYPFIGWNELTKYPTSELYDKMMSTNRSSFTPEKDSPDQENLLPEIPLEVFSTTNPSGVGHNWVRRRFIDVAPYGKVVKEAIEIFNPKTQQEEIVTISQVSIFGSYRENIYLDPKYIAQLDKSTKSDPNLYKAWILGSWDVVAGGALDDLWRGQVHVIPRFKIPRGWRVDRAFDWGSTHPFSVGWFAEANGEEVTLPDGTIFAPQRGSIIQIAEWYGTKEIGTNKGLKLGAKEIAQTIRLREKFLTGEMGGNIWIPQTPLAGPADNQIAEVREVTTDSYKVTMEKEGVYWTTSDKSSGSRKNGLQLIRDRLEASLNREGPGLYFMNNCRASIEILPRLPRNDDDLDDVDTTAEDHPYDMVRYRVLKGNNRFADTVDVKW